MDYVRKPVNPTGPDALRIGGDLLRVVHNIVQSRLAFAKESSASSWAAAIVPLGRVRQVRNDFRSKAELILHSQSRSWSKTSSQVNNSSGLLSCASTRRRISSRCSGETATGSDSMLFQMDSTIRNRSETGKDVSSESVCCRSTDSLPSLESPLSNHCTM